MQYATPYKSSVSHYQKGAALFMALIFLLILTILGVFGMNISRLENMMAGNSQFQTTALNNAEYTLIRGDKDIEDIAKTGTMPFATWAADDHYYTVGTTDDPGTTHVETPKDLVWPFTSQTVSLPDGGTGEYVIENAGLDNTKGEDASYSGTINPLPGAVVQVFLVTAKSETSRGAARIVQSVVVTDPLPPTP